MSITKPWTFTDGTGNVIYATRVNDNFDTVYDAVNAGALSSTDSTLTSLLIHSGDATAFQCDGSNVTRLVMGDGTVTSISTSTSLGTSDAVLPTQKAIKTYVDNQVLSENIWDSTSGIITQLRTNNEQVYIKSDSSVIKLETGAGNIVIDATGNVNETASSAINLTGATVNATASAGNIVIDATGNVNETASSAINLTGATVNATASAGIVLDAATLNAQATSSITMDATSGNLSMSGSGVILRATSGNIAISTSAGSVSLGSSGCDYTQAAGIHNFSGYFSDIVFAPGSYINSTDYDAATGNRAGGIFTKAVTLDDDEVLALNTLMGTTNDMIGSLFVSYDGSTAGSSHNGSAMAVIYNSGSTSGVKIDGSNSGGLWAVTDSDNNFCVYQTAAGDTAIKNRIGLPVHVIATYIGAVGCSIG